MDQGPSTPTNGTNLTWKHVAYAFTFVLFDAFISFVYRLGVGSSMVTASVRCIVQLSFLALILQKVFDTNNVFVVAAIAFLLNFLGTVEAVVHKSKMRCNYLFSIVLFANLASNVPVSFIGIYLSMAVEPIWKPEQYIPVMGMLTGNAITGIVIVIAYILKELHENTDKVETYLAYGATRYEACSIIARDALRLGLNPVINMASVIGIISIPGTMTGAMLGGASVEQAAMLQMVLMFMITASSALAAIATTCLVLAVVVDGEHRIRDDRIDVKPNTLRRARDYVGGWFNAVVRSRWEAVKWVFKRKEEQVNAEGDSERQGLLG